ncbi:hypothetical protein AB0G04_15940 [Actinoplanes sp. NPDC023801]|uniref:hypothetical protein n=1 Tax=Actinoplanes sp. NPDC023801 TaxID=3154595 RepID=UPI0033D43C86
MTYPPHPGEPNPSGYPPPQPPYGQQPPQYGTPQQPQYGTPQQPQYGTPQQPQYGSPQPPQYGAPAPQYGQPGQLPPPGFPPPGAPQRKSRVLPIILIVVGILAVLCIGGGAALYFVGKDAVDDAAAVSITEPATLGGRPKLDTPEYATLTADMEKSLAAYPGASSSFGAFYGDPEKQDMVAAIATKALIANPQAELDASFKTFSKDAPVSGLTDAGTGTLGGVAKCGTSAFSGIDVAVCGWADEGSVGMIMWFFKKAPDVQAEFPKLRAEIETKSK